MEQVYLGNSLYASFDGECVTLAASNGIVTTNEVVLEPSALEELLNFLRTIAMPVQQPAAYGKERCGSEGRTQ
ncbi:MAG: hypothetical protein ACLPPF_14380 [Rhodomicrobium sp.]